MKFGTLLSDLAKKAGVDTTQQPFIDLLAIQADIPDDIAGALNKGLLNIEAAKNNPEVRKAIRTEALNGVDSKVAQLLEELGIEDADDITGEKNSYEKIGKLAAKVKELESKKAGTNNKADKADIEKQIADLNKALKDQKDLLLTKENEWKGQREADLNRFDLHKKLLGKDYALPKEMDSDLKLSTAEAAVNKALASKGLKLVRTETGMAVVDKDGNKAYNENHEEIQVDSLIDGALAQNKLLRVNDPNNPAPGNNGSGNHIPAGGGQGNTSAVNAIDAQMKELGLS